MEYDFRKIEPHWQEVWKKNGSYKVSNESAKPKYYVLDMFPYPSGAGLHVGHPLGYIASDIYSRYKRLKGFNVLHPMGFDSFGLPAEQYALETGQHPATTTEKNIATFKAQLDKIGFCYDWDREVRTSDPQYYKWTQWIFLQLFNSYFDIRSNKAKPIAELIKSFETVGSSTHDSHLSTHAFTAEQWKAFTKKEQEDILMNRRLAFSKYGEVNWCEALGTVLANDEVVNGVSERGGHPVEKKKMRQWYLRITDYADRLLEGLESVDFSDSMKEMQKNWIGKSEGAEMEFKIKGADKKLRVYTTRPDTIFGVDFMVLAPEHDLIALVTGAAQKEEIEKYLAYVKSRSERERLAEAKTITGCFTGAYAVNPFDGREIPVWISEYVLAGYGTGAIMAVPCGDQRDFLFAKHFNIPITNIIGKHFNGEEANPTKEAVLENSGFLNGLLMKDAIGVALKKIEELGMGKKKVNYRMRDAGFSRQRYWGEPFPIVWSDGIAIPLEAEELPLELPHVDKYGPGPEGEGPLANIKEWTSSPSLLHRVEKGDGKNIAKKEAAGATLPKYKTGTPLQYEFAKQMRKEYTEAENVLWQLLRNNQLDVKFRRQHPVESYIADFVCLQCTLIVEVDGGYHETAAQKTYDEERTRLLNEIGFAIIRFTNDEVLQNTEAVIAKIKEAIAKSGSHSKKETTEATEFSHPSPRNGEGQGVRETSTMPGYAGSSWYFLRYMDPKNETTFCDRKASDYWNQVDLYIGGTEHAVGHLLYSRMWTKVLFDLGLIGFDEPFKRLVNQGMITGISELAYRFHSRDKSNQTLEYSGEVKSNIYPYPVQQKNGNITMLSMGSKTYSYYFSADFVTDALKNDMSLIHVPIKFVDNNKLNISKLVEEWKDENVVFVTLNGLYVEGKWYNTDWEEIKSDVFKTISAPEKMSKRYQNVVNPDELCDKYGADTFRMYEMFLGPVEASKPWDTKGIEGVHRFLRKLWRLFNDDLKGKVWNDEKATDAELKILHRTIKKIEEDTERFSFNTAVSTFMICVNELADLKCHKKEILDKLLILLTPYAPHIAEELWSQLGNEGSVLDATYPSYNPALLVESTKEYPVSINGKLRTNMQLALDMEQQQVEELVLQNEIVQKWLDGNQPKKIIFVKNKMINVVI